MSGFIIVKIDGQRHRELSPGSLLQEVEVVQRLNDHWTSKVVIRQTSDERFPAENCLGKDLEIVAVDQAGTEHVLFEGIVLDSELEYEVFGSYTARLQGVTRTYKLDQSARHQYYRRGSLQSVVDQVVSDDELTAEIGPIPTHTWDPQRQLNFVQWGESDFDYINRLADDSWAWTRPTKEGIEVRGEFDSGSELRWRTENGLQKFKIRGRLGQPSVDGVHYDIRAREVAEYTGVSREPEFYESAAEMVAAVQRESVNNLTSGSIFSGSRAPSPDEYQQMLEKESVRSIGCQNLAEGVSRNPALRAGNEVNVQEFLDASGTYGLIEVVHRWTPKGYENQFTATPWKHYFSPTRPQQPQFHGVTPAVVIEHNDPRRLGRVKVRYPWMADGETGWARMVFPHAGGNRGFVFMPEVGDEVLVAFENADPERPYVVGCLFNGQHTQPHIGFRDETEQERQGAQNEDFVDNNIKRIVTRSGAGLHMNDRTGDEAVSLNVPGDLRLLMTHNNPKSPGRELIMLHAAEGDIVLSAPNGRIHMFSKYVSEEINNAGASDREQGTGAGGQALG